ncbi:MAG: DnaJ domain-containing protein [SAR324 cluster bacterium]|nr:DnaJ domain-containing protein [SAR324 cluster bacterium]
MRLSKKQQAIVDIVSAQGSIDKPSLFEALEGVIQDKKKYHSRYSSLSQTIKKIIEKGILEQNEDRLALASETTQEKVKRTDALINALLQLREQGLPLTLANLKKSIDLRDWIWEIVQWKLSTSSSKHHRIIDLDEVLDAAFETFEVILEYLKIDAEKVFASGLVFSARHHQELQRKTHDLLREKILKFSLAHQTIKSAIEAKLSHQHAGKTVCELIEPVVRLTEKECRQIASYFENEYLQKVGFQYLSQMFESHHAFESRLELRFPSFFTGDWEWDRLYRHLQKKILEHVKSHNLYYSPEEWKQHLKQQARDRFQNAQQHQTKPNPSDISGFSKTAAFASYYQILGVEETAGVEEIRVAFRKLAKAYHPDQGGDPEFFRSLNQAYTRLMSHLENKV